MSAALTTLRQLGLYPIFIRHRQLDRFANQAVELKQRYMVICIQFFSLSILQFFNSSILLSFPYHIGSPEIGQTVTIDVVRMILVVAALANQFYDVLRFLLSHGLPEAGYQTADHRTGERGSHVAHDDAAAIDQPGRGSDGDHIRLDASVLGRTHTAERGYAVGRYVVDGTNGKDIVGIGRNGNLLPRSHAGVTGRVDQHDALLGQ